MKHYISVKAICPYYKHEGSQVIYCDGIVDASVLHLAFATKTDAKAFKEKHCRADFPSCKIYKMLRSRL